MIDSVPQNPRYWALVPAAGIGSRMGAEVPKQYLTLHGKTILEHTLERLLQIPGLEGIIVAINPFDEYWQQLPLSNHAKIETVDGGQERSDSVINGLRALRDRAHKLDWILVHDAARPCVTLDSIQSMFDALEEHLVGGVLGVPVSDTLKRINEEYGIEATVDRRVLWHAQTPQMFRFGILHHALHKALAEEFVVTDEASAVERAGYQPLMVEGRRDNLKITRPEDLALAEVLLQIQGLHLPEST